MLDGVRLPYSNAEQPPSIPTLAFSALPGVVVSVSLPAFTFFDGTLRGSSDPTFSPVFASGPPAAGLDVRIAVDRQGNNRFPFRNSPTPGGLTAQEVQTILTQGIQTAYSLRAAIREPQDSFVQVNIFVVDVDGVNTGISRDP